MCLLISPSLFHLTPSGNHQLLAARLSWSLPNRDAPITADGLPKAHLNAIFAHSPYDSFDRVARDMERIKGGWMGGWAVPSGWRVVA